MTHCVRTGCIKLAYWYTSTLPSGATLACTEPDCPYGQLAERVCEAPTYRGHRIFPSVGGEGCKHVLNPILPVVAAECGDVATLKWFRINGSHLLAQQVGRDFTDALDNAILLQAIRGGRMEVLRWARKNGLFPEPVHQLALEALASKQMEAFRFVLIDDDIGSTKR